MQGTKVSQARPARPKCFLFYRYTVIFVAFDKEEYGSQGSHEFLRGYLVPKLFKVSYSYMKSKK